MSKRASATHNAKVRAAAATLKKDYVSRTQVGKVIVAHLKKHRKHGLTQTMAANIVGDAATQFSRLCNGHYGEFSIDRLFGFVVELGGEVAIAVRMPNRPFVKRGRVKLVVLRQS